MPDKAGYVILLTVLMVAGCADGERHGPEAASLVSEERGPEEDTTKVRAFRYLQNADDGPMRAAFEVLRERNYTRNMRTEQLDEDGRWIAFEERTIRYSGAPESREQRIVEEEFGGAFDYGFLDVFVSRKRSVSEPTGLATDILPEDPSYLSERNRHAYDYRRLPDTLMWGRTVRVIEVRALPGEGDAFSIRHVRLYVEVESRGLVAVYLERADRAIWLRENSRYFLQIRPAPSGGWIPFQIRVETDITMPFRKAQRFRMRSYWVVEG